MAKPRRSAAERKADVTRSWKLKRRHKYISEGEAKPKANKRARYWVAGYSKADGTYVKGHWRANAAANKKGVYAKTGVGSRKQAKKRK